MSLADEWDRDALLALTPQQYLQQGFRDDTGRTWPELQSVYATAVATQFEAAGVSFQELSATSEAFQLVLPLHGGTAGKRYTAICAEALETVSMMMNGQPNNQEIISWLNLCGPAIKVEEDLASFIEHFVAVVRQYGITAALKQ